MSETHDNPRGGTLGHFEALLARRTKVPAHRLGEYLGWSPPMLKQEIQAITGILKRFADAVVQAMDDPAHTGNFLRELDLKTISLDHDWRAIFSTIRARQETGEDFGQAAIIKYLQFLSFRKRLFEYVYARKASLQETEAYTSASLNAIPDTEAETDGLRRLPLGEAVSVGLFPEQSLHIRLARDEFRLVGGSPPALVTPDGTRHSLRQGRMMLGRHPAADIPIASAYGLVSRAHLILEYDGATRITLTDLSSGGTFLPAGTARH